MNKFQEMEVFVAVVNSGSFVGAADALEMSKPAVSRYVDALEQRLGVRLLQRTTRRLSLTEAGRSFFQHAQEIIAALESAEAQLGDDAAQPVGRIRINVPVTFGVTHLAPLWARFLAQYPKLELDISLNDRQVDLVEEGFDLAVRIGALGNSSLISRRLATSGMRLAAAPEYLAAHGIPQRPEDLLQHQIIAYSYWSGRDNWEFDGPDGKASVHTRNRVYTNNGDTCRRIALDGGGILLQPDFIIGPDLRAGALVEVLPEYHCQQLGIYAVYPSRKHLPHKVRCMVDFLVQSFQDVLW